MSTELTEMLPFLFTGMHLYQLFQSIDDYGEVLDFFFDRFAADTDFVIVAPSII
jgi:hypothetical protein